MHNGFSSLIVRPLIDFGQIIEAGKIELSTHSRRLLSAKHLKDSEWDYVTVHISSGRAQSPSIPPSTGPRQVVVPATPHGFPIHQTFQRVTAADRRGRVPARTLQHAALYFRTMQPPIQSPPPCLILLLFFVIVVKRKNAVTPFAANRSP